MQPKSACSNPANTSTASAPPSSQVRQARERFLSHEAISVLVLVALAAAIQCWVVRHAVVPALDSVRYIGQAQQIAGHGLRSFIKEHYSPPLFPAVVALSERCLAWFDATSPANWIHNAQLMAALAQIASVIPIYLANRRLFGPRAAWLGAILYCVSSEPARLGADGLSDSTHLFWFSVAWWGAVEYFAASAEFSPHGIESPSGRRPSFAWLALAGIAAGIALLARTESLVLFPAIAASLAISVLADFRHTTWPRHIVAGAAMAAGTAAVWVPYLAYADGLQPHAALARFCGRPHAADEPAQIATGMTLIVEANVPTEALPSLLGNEPLHLDSKESAVTSRVRGLPAALRAMCIELVTAFELAILLLVPLGVWRLIRTASQRVVLWPLLFVACYVLATLSVAASAGYLSTRHMLPLVAVGSGFAACGGLHLADRLAGLVHRIGVRTQDAAPRSSAASGRLRVMSACLLFGLVTATVLPTTLAPMHASRVAHRSAADWLATFAPQRGHVLDTRGWTALYSGRVTYRFDAAQAALADEQLAYIVVEQPELTRDSPRSRTLRRLLSLAARRAAVFRHPQNRGAEVLVYHWNPERYLTAIYSASDRQ